MVTITGVGQQMTRTIVIYVKTVRSDFVPGKKIALIAVSLQPM